MPTADLHAQFILRCGFHNQHEGELTKAKKRKTATGPAKMIIVNPDQGAANRIAAIAGPAHHQGDSTRTGVSVVQSNQRRPDIIDRSRLIC
jgi:phosphoribosylpyrophosphate synthetase